MRKFLLALTMAVAVPLAANAQQSNWEFDGIFPSDSANVVHTGSQLHGLAVDAEGKVWMHGYTGRTVEIGGQSAALVRSIWVFNDDGTPADFSPIHAVTVDGVTDTLNVGPGTGLRTDHEGNILASYGRYIFRINHQTGEGMDRFDTNLLRTETLYHFANSVGVTDDGYIAVSYVFGGSPIQLYDPGFNYVGDIESERTGFSRTGEISGDGEIAYQPIYTLGAVVLYESDGGVFGEYAAADTVMHGIAAESMAWDTNGLLWVSAGSKNDRPNRYDGEPTGTNYVPFTWYGFDTETFEVRDMVQWHNLAADSATVDPRPRAVAFSPDGQYVYLGQFGSGAVPGVQRFRYNPTTSSDTEIIPASFELEQNYPNPFNPTTTISYTVREAGQVALKVYDMLGREVATLHNGVLAPGEYNATFDAGHLSSGTYLYVLEAGGQRITRSMVLLK
jgi:hypothetical protein